MKLIYFKRKKTFLYQKYCIILFMFIFNLSIARSQNEIFDEFIVEFALDSNFQVSRVSFPLLYLSWDYEKDEEDSILVSKERYRYSKLYYYSFEHEDAYTVFYDNFKCEFQDTGEMVFRWKGFTDMDIRYYFKRINGKWFLVKILNYDPFVW